MTEPQRIGLLYSYGPHFKKVALSLRARYPSSHITALLPPGYPEAAIRDIVDGLRFCAPTPGARRSPAQAWRLLKVLRLERYDMLVVIYDSPKLQAVAALSGAHQCYCFGLDNRSYPLRLNLCGAIFSGIVRAVRGRIRYAYIWLQVYCRPVKTRMPGDNGGVPPS